MSGNLYNSLEEQIAAVLDKFLNVNNISDMRLEYEKNSEDCWIQSKVKIREETIQEIFAIVSIQGNAQIINRP